MKGIEELSKENMQVDVASGGYLPDEPIDGAHEESLYFGHGSITATLRKIVEECPCPFTIGLFGKWGTGKSTIIKNLQGRLDRKKFAVATVDAWKYEGDSLRRQFLISLDEELGLGKKYRETLNQTMTRTPPEKESIRFDWKLLFNKVSYIALGFIALGIVLKVIASKYDIGITDPTLDVAAFVSIIGALMTFVTQVTAGLVQRVSVSVTDHRTDSAEGFESKFEEVLRSPQLEGKRLFVIIDNLDRCSHDKAIELLSTIKTFLVKEGDVHEQCVFLIACDDEAIKTHIRNVYALDAEDYEPFNEDEYLRKFFNTTIRIPRFLSNELFSYTEKLLEATGIDDLKAKEVAFVIATSYRANPRQIKQFINTLISNYYLARERESGVNPLIKPDRLVTGNVPFLAMMLMIQQRFPEIYKGIQERNLNLDELRAFLGSEISPKSMQEYRNFIDATIMIDAPQNIRPFLYLKQSEEERELPGYDELRVKLEQNDKQYVKEKFAEIKADADQLKHLSRNVMDLLDVHGARKTVLLNIVNTTLFSLRENGMTLEDAVYHKIANLFANSGILMNSLHLVQPQEFFSEVLPNCTQDRRRPILDRFALYLTSKKAMTDGGEIELKPEYVRRLFAEVLTRKNWFSQYSSEIKKAINEKYASDYDFLALLKEDEDAQNAYLDAEIITKYISSLSERDIENENAFESKGELLRRFKRFVTAVVAKTLIQKVNELITNEARKGNWEKKAAFLVSVRKILIEFKDTVCDEINKAEMAQLAMILHQAIQAIRDQNGKKHLIPFAFTVATWNVGRSAELDAQVNAFISAGDVKMMEYVDGELSGAEKIEYVKRYESHIKQRIQTDQGIFDYFYELGMSERRSAWLIDLLCSNQFGRGLEKLKKLNYEVDDPVAVIRNVLQFVAQGVGEPDKGKFYEAVNQMECGKKNDALLNTYKAQIKELLKSNSPKSEETGYLALKGALAYFDDGIKREIVRDVVEEYLQKLDAAHASHPFTIRAVILDWKNACEDEVRKKFLDFVLDKLIRKATAIDNIRLGFEILKIVMTEINDKYYQTYIKDIVQKYTDLNDGDSLKDELRKGLLEIKPNDPVSELKEYWEKVL